MTRTALLVRIAPLLVMGGASIDARAEGIGVAAYASHIELSTGAVTALPGDKSRELVSTGPLVVGAFRDEAHALRTSFVEKGNTVYGTTVVVEEHDVKTSALGRTWRPIAQRVFSDESRIELHTDATGLRVDAHFLTFMEPDGALAKGISPKWHLEQAAPLPRQAPQIIGTRDAVARMGSATPGSIAPMASTMSIAATTSCTLPSAMATCRRRSPVARSGSPSVRSRATPLLARVAGSRSPPSLILLACTATTRARATLCTHRAS